MLDFQGLKMGVFTVAEKLPLGFGYIDDGDGRIKRLEAPGGVTAEFPCSAIPRLLLGGSNAKHTKTQ